jgi:hypothetical protein
MLVIGTLQAFVGFLGNQPTLKLLRRAVFARKMH